MIIEAVIGIFVNVARWGLSGLGTDAPPEWLASVGVFINQQIQGFSGLGAWVPWDFAIGVAAVTTGLWVIIVLVKAIRWVLNWIPTWGGS